MTPRRLIGRYKRFGETYFIHLQVNRRKAKETMKEVEIYVSTHEINTQLEKNVSVISSISALIGFR
jgi:hypothetical protein